jgi:hypothetical protein
MLLQGDQESTIGRLLVRDAVHRGVTSDHASHHRRGQSNEGRAHVGSGQPALPDSLHHANEAAHRSIRLDRSQIQSYAMSVVVDQMRGDQSAAAG